MYFTEDGLSTYIHILTALRHHSASLEEVSIGDVDYAMSKELLQGIGQHLSHLTGM